jgi:hypothetical protein
MLSIDPKLTAAEVKEILIDTGRPGPQALGGKILAMDEAVLLVIGRERARLGRARMTAEELQKAGVIDSVAISRDDEGTWIIKSIVEVVPSRAGMTVTVTATPGVQIKGVPTRRVMVPREVIWAPVVVPQGEAEITVTRSDNGASSTITLGPSPQ